MINGNEADDKIIAVLESDVAHGHLRDIAGAPGHSTMGYGTIFSPTSNLPHEAPHRIGIAAVYDRDDAFEGIRRSVEDYRADFGAPEERMAKVQRLLQTGAR